MAKNFPFFKFVATEWLTGDIVYEEFSTQGLFINICALYWQRDGKLSLNDINKRYKTEIINNLTDRFFAVIDGNISISFLDEQLIDAGHISKVNSENGKKGAEAKRNKATANRPLNEPLAKPSKEEQEEEKEVKENFDFKIPSLEYCIELFKTKTAFNWTENYAVKSANTFYYFYESKNWMVGKNKMKSLNAAIGGWISRDIKPELSSTKTQEQINKEKLDYCKSQGFQL
jgi:hypothetical protein